jgi:glycosyltransferase involved in cell wall biosynthesis
VRKCNVALFNSADPRGLKVGGIETYTRDYIEYHPDDMSILFVGPDEVGDLVLNEINEIEFRGRKIKFLPLDRLVDSTNVAPETISQSETFRFFRLFWQKRRLLKKVLRSGNYSAEIRRVEYAPILWWLGVPVFSMVHIWGDKSQPMSGLIGKKHRIRAITEFVGAALSQKLYAVNPDMTARYRKSYWPIARKFDTLTTWANTSLYSPKPFGGPGPLRLVFAGRTDDFKRHDIMMRVMRKVREAGQEIEYHYVGDGDLERYPEFDAIREVTTRHGRQPASYVADLISRCDIGLLTSEFEGMPRFVIECVASGRPVVALHLPQLEAMFSTGNAGRLIERGDDMEGRLALAILELGAEIRSGSIDPLVVSTAADAHKPEKLLNKIWNDHRRLAGLSERTV